MKFAEDRDIDKLHQLCIVAANGSGKSQFVLAPCIVWFAMSFDMALAYVTSASAHQLDTQTERYIDYLIDCVNAAHRGELGFDPWERVKRKKRFLPTDGIVDLIATDEGGKAEGKHPRRPNAEFCIFVDEGKSITQEIYGALERCNGSTRKLSVSSPGGTSGEFYVIATTPEVGWWVRKVTYKDCPHIREEEVQAAITKYGLHDPLVRSMYFAEFSADDASIVLSKYLIDTCRKYYAGKKLDGYNRMGLDLSGGGDEAVASIWDGNFMVAQYTYRLSQTHILVGEILGLTEKYNISDHHVWADDGGIGKGILGNFADRGHEFNRVNFGSKAYDTTRYLNRGTELWFNFKMYVEHNYIGFYNDSQLFSQLSNRYFKISQGTGKLMLEPKQEAKKKGRPSPDRADACVLAWADRVFDVEVVKPRIVERSDLVVDQSSLVSFYDKITYGVIKLGKEEKTPSSRCKSAMLLADKNSKQHGKLPFTY